MFSRCVEDLGPHGHCGPLSWTFEKKVSHIKITKIRYLYFNVIKLLFSNNMHIITKISNTHENT